MLFEAEIREFFEDYIAEYPDKYLRAYDRIQ